MKLLGTLTIKLILNLIVIIIWEYINSGPELYEGSDSFVVAFLVVPFTLQFLLELFVIYIFCNKPKVSNYLVVANVLGIDTLWYFFMIIFFSQDFLSVSSFLIVVAIKILVLKKAFTAWFADRQFLKHVTSSTDIN